MSGEDRGAPPDAGRQSEAIEVIYRREAPRLARCFRRHMRTGEEDVPDLVQESFARLAGARSRTALLQPAAYLQRIARNLLFDRSRRTEIRLARLHLPVDELAALAVPPEQAFALEAEQLMRLYRQAVAELPDKTRHAFLLHRIEGLGYKAIGAELGISVPTVQYHIARALVHIDRALERE